MLPCFAHQKITMHAGESNNVTHIVLWLSLMCLNVPSWQERKFGTRYWDVKKPHRNIWLKTGIRLGLGLRSGSRFSFGVGIILVLIRKLYWNNVVTTWIEYNLYRIASPSQFRHYSLVRMYISYRAPEHCLPKFPFAAYE